MSSGWVTASSGWTYLINLQPCAERVLIALNNACRHIPKESKVIEPEMLRLLAEAEGALR